jgi:hypothetical protein
MSQPDLIVIGGAVGARWGGPVGWAAFIIIPSTGESKKIVDGSAEATQDDADVMPFAAAIQWWHNAHNSKSEIMRPQVLCITDAPDVITAGVNPWKRNLASDWRFITWFETRGYEISWTWESRYEHLPIIQEALHARKKFQAVGAATPGCLQPQ